MPRGPGLRATPTSLSCLSSTKHISTEALPGAEVALLIRRLRSRLGIGPDRLQVICTSASFSDPDAARQFAASLTGKQVSDFDAVQGALALNQHAGPGNDVDVLKLASVDLDGIYSPVEAIRKQAAAEFLSWRGIDDNAPFEHLLFQALEHYAPMGRLVNLTMQEARPIAEMASELFDVSGLQPDKALTALIALGRVGSNGHCTRGLQRSVRRLIEGRIGGVAGR
jgi:hypothetical protein